MEKLEFTNLQEAFDYFNDETECRRILEMQRWKDGKPVCPHCGNEKHYKLLDGKTYKCANKDCYKKFTATIGTIFENTNIKLSTWFKAIYLATSHKKGISSLQLGIDLGVTQKTAWFILHRIREMLKDKAPEMLGNVIEVDETYIGGKEKNKHKSKKSKGTQGRSTESKVPILGILERNGKVYSVPVKDTSAKTIQPIITERVKENSQVNTDEWLGYKGLEKKFEHKVIQHGKGEYVIGLIHTNTIEGFWSLFKRGIYGIYHQVSPKHLHRYCDEFSYRYNLRHTKDNHRFIQSLSQCQIRLKYKDLIKKIDSEL